MSILWIKVSDEVEIPGSLTEGEAARLQAVFDPFSSRSPWSQALRRFSLVSPPGPVLRFVRGVPYFNASLISLIVSHGTSCPERGPDGNIIYTTRPRLGAYLRLLLSQWRLESYLVAALDSGVPTLPEMQIRESVALGLALQCLTLRLPGRTEAELARWLATPAEAPPAARKTVRRLGALLLHRTRLSPAWRSLWEETSARAEAGELPNYFWDEPDPEMPGPAGVLREQRCWVGIPICPGIAEGRLLFVENVAAFAAPLEGGPWVLAFSRARPESTELFSYAAAVVYAEGGALSHACSVAREQGLPCVSGVGRDFLASVQNWKQSGHTVALRVDGAQGTLELLSASEAI